MIAGHCIAGNSWSTDVWRVLAASVCLYAAGMVLNDHTDRKIDATQRPERPLPSGQIRPAVALGLGLLLVTGCMLLTPLPAWHGAMAVLVLAYDYLLKGIVVLGALVMGALRGMNLVAGALPGVSATMPEQPVLVAAAAYGVYIVAVTLLGVMEDEAKPSPRAVLGLVSVPPLVAFVALLAMPKPWPATGIAGLLVVVYFVRHRRKAWGQAEIRAAMTWLLLGTMVYTSLLCLASSHPWEALAVALLVLPARGIARWIALT